MKNEILEIESKVEERLLTVYKKRLFFQGRILEQELYIIRLILMLRDINATKEEKIKLQEEFDKVSEKLQEK